MDPKRVRGYSRHWLRDEIDAVRMPSFYTVKGDFIQSTTLEAWLRFKLKTKQRLRQVIALALACIDPRTGVRNVGGSTVALVG